MAVTRQALSVTDIAPTSQSAENQGLLASLNAGLSFAFPSAVLWRSRVAWPTSDLVFKGGSSVRDRKEKFKGFQRLVFAGLLVASQVAGARSYIEEDRTSLKSSARSDVRMSLAMPAGQSLGEPESERIHMMLNYGPLANFSTGTGLPPAGQSFDQMSDAEIEELYRQDLAFTEHWLNQAAANPEALSYLGQSAYAHNSDASPGGPRMSALSCMAVAIHGEAAGEPMAGKLAVGETIMVRAGGRPDRVCSVVFARAQFESMTKRQGQAGADSLRAAEISLQRGPGCGLDHFINKRLQLQLGRKIPKWVHNFENRGCMKREIGQHTFYSSCNCRS
jgi:hypothetical protein